MRQFRFFVLVVQWKTFLILYWEMCSFCFILQHNVILHQNIRWLMYKAATLVRFMNIIVYVQTASCPAIHSFIILITNAHGTRTVQIPKCKGWNMVGCTIVKLWLLCEWLSYFHKALCSYKETPTGYKSTYLLIVSVAAIC